MKFSKFKEVTRIEQSFFGLPMLFSGGLLPFSNPQFLKEVNEALLWRCIWILPAFFAARISGMAFNQWIDRHFDALNPRTNQRPIPSGRVNPREVSALAWISLAGFLFFCFQINLLTALIAPLAAALLFIYSYMKRIHASAHFVLGFIHFLSPFMAWIAITGSFSWIPFFLGCASFCIISASDIFYALQDETFDRKIGLHSIPVKLGQKKSIFLARILYGCSSIALCLVGLLSSMPGLYYGAPLILLGIFFYFPRLAAVQGKSKESLFFFLNVFTSFSIFVFILLGIIVDVWRVLL